MTKSPPPQGNGGAAFDRWLPRLRDLVFSSAGLGLLLQEANAASPSLPLVVVYALMVGLGPAGLASRFLKGRLE